MTSSEPRDVVSQEQYEKVFKTARELLDAVIWMSGSSDFGPEGEAHDGWVKVRTETLEPALELLGPA